MKTTANSFDHLKSLSAAQILSLQTVASDAAAGLNAQLAQDVWEAAQARAAATRAAAARASALSTSAIAREADRHGWAAVMQRVVGRRK